MICFPPIVIAVSGEGAERAVQFVKDGIERIAPLLGPAAQVLREGRVFLGELAGALHNASKDAESPEGEYDDERGGRRGIAAGQDADGTQADSVPQPAVAGAQGRLQFSFRQKVGISHQTHVAVGKMLGDLQPGEITECSAAFQSEQRLIRQMPVFMKQFHCAPSFPILPAAAACRGRAAYVRF